MNKKKMDTDRKKNMSKKKGLELQKKYTYYSTNAVKVFKNQTKKITAENSNKKVKLHRI